eukprot:8775819-Pyramimonas_sp.AAC.1
MFAETTTLDASTTFQAPLSRMALGTSSKTVLDTVSPLSDPLSPARGSPTPADKQDDDMVKEGDGVPEQSGPSARSRA